MNAATPGTPPPLGRYLVRVLRAERRDLVEFEFAVNGPELAVELVLPLPQFRDFCARYGAEVSIATEALVGWHRLTRTQEPAGPTGGTT
jgi:hypothetical protein